MPVGLQEPNELLAVSGVKLAVAASGMRYKGRDDLLLIQLSENSKTSAVFTQNKFCAAPVMLAKQHLSETSPMLLVVNAGNANAGTGQQGMGDAQLSCQVVAEQLKLNTNQVMPFSTGVIGMPMDMSAYRHGVESAAKNFNSNWLQAAKAIMTTDIVAKAKSVQLELGGEKITITGIAKGSGMICPNMATMLAYICTDANISQPTLNQCVKQIADLSFNRITVDGDTSTNDCFTLSATGKADNQEINDVDSMEGQRFFNAVLDVATSLAQAIVRDGEGATKFVEIQVKGSDLSDCKKVAYTVAHSPLVKTALFASDPNWGRILAAVGRSPINKLDISSVGISVNNISIIENGSPSSSYTEEQGQVAFNEEELEIVIMLDDGQESCTLWTCDFSHEYVSINADYRS